MRALLIVIALVSAPRRKPLPVDVAVAAPVVRLCTCTAMNCQRCNTCWCYVADGGVEEIRP